MSCLLYTSRGLSNLVEKEYVYGLKLQLLQSLVNGVFHLSVCMAEGFAADYRFFSSAGVFKGLSQIGVCLVVLSRIEKVYTP